MNRSKTFSATVFSIKPLGENNFSVTLFSALEGISYATLYGGPKSRLKSLVSLWNTGTVYIYENPEKKQAKITDFDVKNYHESFSSSLFKTYAANLAAELAIKTRCAGSNEECFKIVSGFLDGMELCDEEQSRLGLIRFLWRFIGLLGVRPETNLCSQCSCNLEKSYYNDIDNVFYCETCANELILSRKSSGNFFPCGREATAYLEGVANLSPREARSLSVTKETYAELRQIMFRLLENSIGQKINSISTGVGIL